MTLSDDSPRVSGRTIVIIAVLVLLVLAAGAVVWTNTQDEGRATGTSTTSTSTSASATPSSGGSVAGANGCLGGVNPTKAVLPAQTEAGADGRGAAAFAATVMRWRVQFPPDEGYEAKAARIMTEDAGEDLLTVSAPAGGPNDSGWASTDGARYTVTVSDDQATVAIVMPVFVTSADAPEPTEVQSAARWRLVRDGDVWRVMDMDPIEGTTSEQVARDGHTFTGVC